MTRKLLYGTESPKRMNVAFQPFPHDHPRAETTEDGSEIHKFRFAFPKGTLDRRMSAKELADFVLQHIVAVLNMRLLDFTDFVCECGWRSRLQSEDTICPVCNHKCTTVNRTEVQEAFAEVLEKFVNISIQLQQFSEVSGSMLQMLPPSEWPKNPPVFTRAVRTYSLKETIDELVPWAKISKAGDKPACSGAAQDDNDYVELNPHDKKPWAERKMIFDVGGG